jgi:hypothetical protein
MDPHRNATTIIRNLTRTVPTQSHLDGRAVTGHRLIYRVIHDLPYQVVETGRTGRPDVHSWSFPDGLKALENGDISFAVGRLGGRHLYRSPMVVRFGKKGAAEQIGAVQNRRSKHMFTVGTDYQQGVLRPRI